MATFFRHRCGTCKRAVTNTKGLIWIHADRADHGHPVVVETESFPEAA